MKLRNRGEDKENDEVKDQKRNEGKIPEEFEQGEGKEELEENVDIAKYKKENAIKISCKDSRGRSPIFNACEKNNLRALKLLLEAGFDPDEEDREGWRPIQVAMSNETRSKNSRNKWKNIEAEECVFHLLSSSGEVRKRTQADDSLRR